MASGARVHDSSLAEFDTFKLKASSAPGSWIIFKINISNSGVLGEIVVDSNGRSSAATAEGRYEEFLATSFSNNQCQWAVYNFEYETGDGKQSKIIFLRWIPDEAKIKEKMLYASPTEALQSQLTGISVKVSASELSELSYDEVLDQVASRRRG